MTPARRPAEAGFTLIELIVAMSFAVVVLTLVGGMLISALGTERDVRSTTSAANLGQLISRSVQSGVRNASQVSLTTNLDNSQFLVARTAEGQNALVWACQAWYFTPADGGSVYIKRTSPAAAILAPTASTLPTWTKLGEGVSAAGAVVFGGVDDRITLDLDLDTGEQASVAISSTATMRILATVSDPCF